MISNQVAMEIYTFGFKYPDWRKKVKEDCKIVDVREYINDPPPKFKGVKLHQLSGKDKALRELIMDCDKAQRLLTKLEKEISGNIALGCTSGRHRSVSVAIELGKILTAKGYTVTVTHLYI